MTSEGRLGPCGHEFDASRGLLWDLNPAFTGNPTGTKSLSELFDGRSQLLVYHLMFGPDDAEACPGCSFTADSLDGAVVHLNHHDVTLLSTSRAPLERLDAYKRSDRGPKPGYVSWSTDSTLPAGSLNQAMYGPWPREMPFSSCSKPSYLSKCTPRAASSSTALSMSSTGKFRIV
jgi:Bacterial protein of unknown function (DUF899)